MTVVLITHHMEEAVGADRVIVLNRGSVLLDGTPCEVFQNAGLLQSVGLCVPQSVELMFLLRRAGVRVPLSVLTPEECVPVVERLNNSVEVLRRSSHVVCFDHHPAREEFAELSLRCIDAAACAMIIDRFLDNCGIVARDNIATCLLCGLVTDTGRFQYQNADAAAFHAASRLVAHGADPARVALEVYQSMRVEFLHLKSIVMGRIKTVAHGRVAYSYAYQSDLEACGVTSDECDGLVDVVRSVMGVEVCLFLKGIEGDTKVRGNLRSKGDLNVSEIAAAFGGGGHPAAAGFSNNGTILETLTVALPMLAELVGEDPASVTVEL